MTPCFLGNLWERFSCWTWFHLPRGLGCGLVRRHLIPFRYLSAWTGQAQRAHRKVAGVSGPRSLAFRKPAREVPPPEELECATSGCMPRSRFSWSPRPFRASTPSSDMRAAWLSCSGEPAATWRAATPRGACSRGEARSSGACTRWPPGAREGCGASRS